MATSFDYYPHQNSSSRALAMVMALVLALILSPLYIDHMKSESRLETRWRSGGLMLPAVVAGLIVAIRTTTTTSSSYNTMKRRAGDNNEDDSMFRMGSSSWGLAGILIMLLFVISWQGSVQHFFWK